MPCARGFEILRAVETATRPASSPGQRAHLRAEAIALVRSEGLIDPAYSYRIVPLDAEPGETLLAGGEAFHAPQLLPESGKLTALACGACTIGAALGEAVTGLFAARKASLAVALDMLGTELLFAVGRRMQDRMLADARRRGLSMAGELHPGDPGMELEAQAGVVRLAQGELVGISVRNGGLLYPLKSGSVVMGTGIDLPPATWSRCDHCPSRAKCALHSEPRVSRTVPAEQPAFQAGA